MKHHGCFVTASTARTTANPEGANSHCASCGALVDQPGEFHPHVFCTLKQAYPSKVPWDMFRDTVASLGVQLPKKPPLVRDLPIQKAGSRP